MAVLVLVGIKLLPESRNPNPGPWDLRSVVLSLVGMVGVVYAVKETAAHGFAWLTLGVGLLGAAALYGFVRRQLTMPAPLLDMRLFRSRGFSGAVLADLLTILACPGWCSSSPVPATGAGQAPVRGGPGRTARRGRRGGGRPDRRPCRRRFSVARSSPADWPRRPGAGRADRHRPAHRISAARCRPAGRRRRRGTLLHRHRRRDPLQRAQGAAAPPPRSPRRPTNSVPPWASPCSAPS